MLVHPTLFTHVGYLNNNQIQIRVHTNKFNDVFKHRANNIIYIKYKQGVFSNPKILVCENYKCVDNTIQIHLQHITQNKHIATLIFNIDCYHYNSNPIECTFNEQPCTLLPAINYPPFIHQFGITQCDVFNNEPMLQVKIFEYNTRFVKVNIGSYQNIRNANNFRFYVVYNEIEVSSSCSSDINSHFFVEQSQTWNHVQTYVLCFIQGTTGNIYRMWRV